MRVGSEGGGFGVERRDGMGDRACMHGPLLTA